MINNKKLLFFISIIFIIILFLIWLFCFKIDIRVNQKTLAINLYDDYKEEKYKAQVCLFNTCKDITDKVIVENNINTNKSGKYKIEYKLKFFFKTKKIIKIVNVTNDKLIKDTINDIEKYIGDNNYNISIGYVSLINDYTYKYEADKIYFGASLIKTLDALYMYEKTDLTDKNKELVKNAISVSDNASHYELLDIIGYDNLKNYGISLGAKNTLKGDRVNGYTTVDDQIIYLQKLYNFINNNELGDELKSYFINDYGLRLNFRNDITIMHKFGHYDQVYHDVGIVLDDNPYIIVVLTEEAKKDYTTIIKNLSQKIYNLNKYVTN